MTESRLIDIIGGARPNFMKIAPIISALQDDTLSRNLSFRIIHTGQHYDAAMSSVFFGQLGIPEPDINLQVGSGSQATQTGAIMKAYEEVLEDQKPDLCLVVGDVNSTLACAVTAKKACVRVAHVEAGIRSNDWNMPEEVNRVVTDALADYFFTTSSFANKNLLSAGVSNDRIFFVGNTMIDTLLTNRDRLQQPACWQQLQLEKGAYFLLTLHRPSNVDDAETFAALINTIAASAEGCPIVFVVHPRTRGTLDKMTDLPDNLHDIPPQPYLEFGYLALNAKAVITDSGGITEECTVNGVPCITMRDSTERPETVSEGTNVLVGNDFDALRREVATVLHGKWKSGKIPELWDGKAGRRVVQILDEIV